MAAKEQGGKFYHAHMNYDVTRTYDIAIRDPLTGDNANANKVVLHTNYAAKKAAKGKRREVDLGEELKLEDSLGSRVRNGAKKKGGGKKDCTCTMKKKPASSGPSGCATPGIKGVANTAKCWVTSTFTRMQLELAGTWVRVWFSKMAVCKDFLKDKNNPPLCKERKLVLGCVKCTGGITVKKTKEENKKVCHGLKGEAPEPCDEDLKKIAASFA